MTNKITPESVVIFILMIVIGIFWFNIDNIVVTPKKLNYAVIGRIEALENRLDKASKDKDGNVQNMEKTIDQLISNMNYIKNKTGI